MTDNILWFVLAGRYTTDDIHCSCVVAEMDTERDAMIDYSKIKALPITDITRPAIV